MKEQGKGREEGREGGRKYEEGKTRLILFSLPCSCGQVGHLAENCSSNERLCFNCGKGGHESSACPEPRTAEQKSCYLCLGKGHIKVSGKQALALPLTSSKLTFLPSQADCPNLAARPPRAAAAPAAAAVGTAGGAALSAPVAGTASSPSAGCYVSDQEMNDQQIQLIDLSLLSSFLAPDLRWCSFGPQLSNYCCFSCPCFSWCDLSQLRRPESVRIG